MCNFVIYCFGLGIKKSGKHRLVARSVHTIGLSRKWKSPIKVMPWASV